MNLNKLIKNRIEFVVLSDIYETKEEEDLLSEKKYETEEPIALLVKIKHVIVITLEDEITQFYDIDKLKVNPDLAIIDRQGRHDEFVTVVMPYEDLKVIYEELENSSVEFINTYGHIK